MRSYKTGREPGCKKRYRTKNINIHRREYEKRGKVRANKFCTFGEKFKETKMTLPNKSMSGLNFWRKKHILIVTVLDQTQLVTSLSRNKRNDKILLKTESILKQER